MAKSQQKTACYVRVSTTGQHKGADSQERALKTYIQNHGIKGVRWYRDVISGRTLERPEFEKLQKDIFKGRVRSVIVWKLDRLSRSMRDGIDVLTDWIDHGVHVTATAQGIDFNGTTGRLIAAVLLGLGQMEREGLREATLRGLQAARDRGSKLGRPRALSIDKVLPLLNHEGLNISQAAERLGVSRPTLYAALKREDVDIKKLRKGTN